MTESDQPDKPAEVRGVTQADYAQWKRHPVTQWFMAYLRDCRDDLVMAATAQWLAGDLQLSTEHEMRGRALALDEVATMPFDAIKTFYEHIDLINEESNAGRSAPDQTRPV